MISLYNEQFSSFLSSGSSQLVLRDAWQVRLAGSCTINFYISLLLLKIDAVFAISWRKDNVMKRKKISFFLFNIHITWVRMLKSTCSIKRPASCKQDCSWNFVVKSNFLLICCLFIKFRKLYWKGFLAVFFQIWKFM